jgi:putative flippase GtrA
MFKCLNEYSHLRRYIASGALNTIVGFSIIFLLTAFGISPFLANICGYLAGFILGFFVTKKFVFNSKDRYFEEGLRYLIAFLACFLLNFLVLSIAIREFQISALIAQIFATVAYTLSMYLTLRYFVFLNRNI